MSERPRVMTGEMGTMRTLRGSGLALVGLAVVAGASWIYLASGAGLGSAMRGMHMAGGAMMPMTPAWSPGYAVLMLGMWTVMMTAMMLPTSTLAVLRIAGQAGNGHGDAIRGLGRAAGFAAGYLAIWAGFGAAATGLQRALDSAHLLSEAMALRNAALAGLVVMAVGVYQLTPLKRACLERCRALDSCLANVETRAWGPVRSGLHYAVSCVGCCAALMSLLFVGGLMSVPWVAAIAVWVLAEKTLPWGVLTARLGGAGLIAGGTVAFTIALAHA
jgi:predicted metal-binding membrane protein